MRNTLTTLDPAARGDDASEGALERFTPVVTSSLAIAAVMLPFAILGSGVGLEILQPMAIVVLGGLVTTVLHALLVLPALSAAVPAPEPDPDEEILDPATTSAHDGGVTMSACSTDRRPQGRGRPRRRPPGRGSGRLQAGRGDRAGALPGVEDHAGEDGATQW